MAVTTGSMALAAQARGTGDDRELSEVARQSLSLAVIMSLILGALGFLGAKPLLTFLNSGGDPEAVALGTVYLQILFGSTTFLLLNLTINSLMQGAGDTVTPLYLSGAMNVLNVGISYLLMFGPGPFPELGVAGIAWGTALSSGLASLAGLVIIYSGRNRVRLLPGSYRPNLERFRQILSIGVPSGLQGIARNGAQILVVRIVTSTAAGTYGASALAIGLQVESLAFMPGLALSIAATSLVGQSLGAWQTRDARERGNVALWVGMAIMSLLGLILFLFAAPLVRLFDPSAHPTVVAAGTSYLRINALSQPLLAVAMVLNGTLRGAGDTRPGLVGTVVGRWLVVVPSAWLLAHGLGMGVDGVWWALFIGTAVQGAWVLYWWLDGRWLGVALRKSRLYRLHLHRLDPAVQQRYLDEVKAPLMAQPGARELVEPDRVIYQLPEGPVEVVFDDGYRLLQGSELRSEGATAEARQGAEGPASTAPRRQRPVN